MPVPPGPNLTAAVRTAWFVFARMRPSLPRVFLAVVLPLSLLPPFMLYYAGTRHGDEFMPGFASRDWTGIALVVFTAELATVSAMGVVIQWIARFYGLTTDRTSAYLMAFMTPIPLWLSSLALLLPSFAFAAGIGLVAFGVSCLLIYHGVTILLRIREEVEASSIAFGIMGCGLLAWGTLLLIVMPI